MIEYAFIRMQITEEASRPAQNRESSERANVVDYSAHQNEVQEEAEIDTTTVIFIYQSRGEFWFNEKGNPKNPL